MKEIPHGHFRVLLKDDNFLKKGLESQRKLEQKIEANKKVPASGGMRSFGMGRGGVGSGGMGYFC